jgi:hypothetical protein
MEGLQQRIHDNILKLGNNGKHLVTRAEAKKIAGTEIKKELLKHVNTAKDAVQILTELNGKALDDALEIFFERFKGNDQFIQDTCKELMKDEAKSTTQSGALFRGSSIFSSLMSKYLGSKMEGYANKLLKECLIDLLPSTQEKANIEKSVLEAAPQALKQIKNVLRVCLKK